jgi:SAM-dependent methyltransferase
MSDKTNQGANTPGPGAQGASSEWKQRTRSFYDHEAAGYADSSYGDDPRRYPANRIRLRHVLDVLKAKGARRVLDVGCGSGTPMLRMLEAGFDVSGFDFSDAMVEEARKLLSGRGHDPARVKKGDAESRELFAAGQFDAVTALGVFPHVIDEPRLIGNMARALRPGGLFLAEFRNALFSAFTLNRYSFDFYREAFLESPGVLPMGSGLGQGVEAFYKKAFGMAETPPPSEKAGPGGLTYADLIAKFHNPLTVPDLVKDAGLRWQENIYYHFHVAPPAFQQTDWDEFRRLSLEMEDRFCRDWRGMFMASAFVAVAVKQALA